MTDKFAIYNRTSDVPLATGTLEDLTLKSSSFGRIFNPRIMWDPDTNRFYYVAIGIVDDGFGASYQVEEGWSTSASPSSAADFCHYNYTSDISDTDFYDYPTLGDTTDLVIFGANVFNGPNGAYLRSDVVSLNKPAAGPVCPSASTFTATATSLTGADGQPAFTPIPVNQTDPSGTGWIVSGAHSGTRNFLSVFQVTATPDKHMVVGPAKKVPVPTFTTPANAVQKGSTNKLDSLDTRLTNAVSAVDPAHGSGVGIWTQHTVFGGPGAEVRWYEINPSAASPALFQSGTVGSSSLFAFNGAIAPDRRVNGTTQAFGSSMVLGFNTSSSTQFPDIRAVSKKGTQPQSNQETIVSATGPEDDASCAGGLCKSGRYGGASPDPASDSTKVDGVVWQTNQLAGGAAWKTWNFAGRPSPK